MDKNQLWKYEPQQSESINIYWMFCLAKRKATVFEMYMNILLNHMLMLKIRLINFKGSGLERWLSRKMLALQAWTPQYRSSGPRNKTSHSALPPVIPVCLQETGGRDENESPKVSLVTVEKVLLSLWKEEEGQTPQVYPLAPLAQWHTIAYGHRIN